MPWWRKSTLRLVFATVVMVVAATLRLGQISTLPPGLHYDEAFHLLTGEQISRGEAFPAYDTGNQGNEPLFAYSAALWVTVLGPVNWAGRLTAALYGLVSTAATIRPGREFFP